MRNAKLHITRIKSVVLILASFFLIITIATANAQQVESQSVFGQENPGGDLPEEGNQLLEEHNINLEEVKSINYGDLGEVPPIEATAEEVATYRTQVPITFTLTDGSEKTIMDSVTLTLEYQTADNVDSPNSQSIETIYTNYCTATYHSSWYGEAKSETMLERDSVTHKVRTYSHWITLPTHDGYWPWDDAGGLYYIEGGSYGAWIDQITTHHRVYWEMSVWPYSRHSEDLVYQMNWNACVVLSP